MNLNKAIIIGNLTRDPEIRTLPSGQPVASFGVATNRIWNKDGQKQQDTQFHNVVLFGRLAEIAKQYLAKGSMVMVEGRINNRSWQAQDGSKRYRTEIVAEKMQLGPRKMAQSQRDSAPPPEGELSEADNPAEKIDTIQYPDEENINPEDIPF